MKQLALLLGGLLPGLASAQPSLPPPGPVSLAPPPAGSQRHYWADLEVGRSTLGSLAFGADLHGELGRCWLLTAGVHNESSDAFLFGSRGHEYNLDSYQVLAGKIMKGRACFVTASAGLALLQVHSYVDGGLFTLTTNDRHQTTLGVPVQVQGYLVALRKFGLGAMATLNLNTVSTSASLGLALAVGHLPTRRPASP